MNSKFLAKILNALGLGNYFSEMAEEHEPKNNYEPLKSVKYLRQIVTKDSRKSRMIMWESERAGENFFVEWQLVGDNAAHYSSVNRRDLICFCELNNLKPASLYRFRIISGEKATSWQNLRTAGNGEFQMIIFSDSQCENYEIWWRTAEEARRNYSESEIFLVNGDLTDNGESEYQWRKFFSANIFSERIFAPVMGNHECYGVDWLNALPTGYLNEFELPSNGSKKFNGYFYSFDYGAANFFILNTQFAEIERFKTGLDSAQEYFFRRAVSNANRKWRIVFMHKDIYDYGQDKFNDIAEKFMDLFAELEIDLVFTGHLHTYRNRGRIKGAIYILCGRSGDQKYVETHSEIDKIKFKNLNEEPESFIVLNVSAAEIKLISRTIDGEIIDEFTITKGN